MQQRVGETTASCRAEQDRGCRLCLAAKDRSQLNRHRRRAPRQLLVFCPSPPTPRLGTVLAAGSEGQEMDPGWHPLSPPHPTPPPTGASQLSHHRIQTRHYRSPSPVAQPRRGAGSLSPARPCPHAALLLSTRKGEVCGADVGDLGKPQPRAEPTPHRASRGAAAAAGSACWAGFLTLPHFCPSGSCASSGGTPRPMPGGSALMLAQGCPLPGSCVARGGAGCLPGTCSMRTPLPREETVWLNAASSS